MEGSFYSEILREAVQERDRQQWRERTVWRGEWQLMLGDLDEFQDKLKTFLPNTRGEDWPSMFCYRVGQAHDIKVKVFENYEGVKVTVSSHKCCRPISFRLKRWSLGR